MNSENNSQEQNEQLKEMNYSPENDIFNQEEAISLDGDGNPITSENPKENMPFGLDIPGFEDDDNFEQINSQIPTRDESLHTDAITEDNLEDEN